MTRYLEIVFRSKLRLLVLLLALPVAVSAIDLYLWRSYEVSEVVWVDDPTIYGRGATAALGYNQYLTPAQNSVLLFSNLLGTQSFNEAIADRLAQDGVIQSESERALLIRSLTQLSVAPGGSVSSGGGGGAGGSSGLAPSRIMTIRYICSKERFCLQVLSVVLETYRTQYADLKARAVASARAIYEDQLQSARLRLAAAIAALQQYEAQKPPVPKGQQSNKIDPVESNLQHDVDEAQAAVDAASIQVQTIDVASQAATGISNDMTVIDGPKTKEGLFGIRGLRSDNLKTDAIAWGVCFAAALAYLVLVAFVDRTVREPEEIKTRLGKAVVTIPDYRIGGRRRWPWRLRKSPA